MRKFAVVIIAAALFLEAVLRMAGFASLPLYIADPDIGYMLKARQTGNILGKTYYYNSYHQRSAELSKNPAYRIFIIGDSIVNGGEGIAQGKTITELLKQKLDNRFSAKGEVLNASAGSWAIFNEAEYIKRFGVFGARIVIWEIGTHDLLQLKSVLSPSGDLTHPVKKPFTAIGGFIRKFVLPRFSKRPAGTAFLQNGPGARNMDKKWDKQFKPEIISVIDSVKKGGSRLIVILVPQISELKKEPTTFWKDRIIRIFEEQGVDYINLLKAGGLRKEYYRKDGLHFNEQGNEFVAEELFQYILKAWRV